MMTENIQRPLICTSAFSTAEISLGVKAHTKKKIIIIQMVAHMCECVWLRERESNLSACKMYLENIFTPTINSPSQQQKVQQKIVSFVLKPLSLLAIN